MQDGLTRYVKFLSTPSARRATPRGKQATESTAISIHALREEGDRRVVPLFGLTLYFYPRPPRGGRPPSQDRRGTTQNFYPRPPRGGRLGCRWALSRASRFLSTPSARRATLMPRTCDGMTLNFYPRPPRGGRPHVMTSLGSSSNFYPRPPRGGRPACRSIIEEYIEFLSTPSARRATDMAFRKKAKATISIHALREEGDRTTVACLQKVSKFLSTPSARRATAETPSLSQAWIFLSTPSARRATATAAASSAQTKISIHALREEGDRFPAALPAVARNFYPRPPRGGRRPPHRRPLTKREFLSTPSARRATGLQRPEKQPLRISIHALREEGDP